MKVLFLSFYFSPDLCAGSFRNTPLAIELERQLRMDKSRDGLDEVPNVSVFTTIPNRYATFSADCPEQEIFQDVYVTRIQLPTHKSGMFDQIRAFYTYYRAVIKQTKNQHYDLVYASSSRLFTAFLGSVLSRKKNIPLFLDIRDIFVDTLQDVLKSKFLKIGIMPVLKWIENRTFSQASHINLISGGFAEYFSKWDVPKTYFTNGIDDAFLKESHDLSLPVQNSKVITYAGNIGEGQGLHHIIPQAAELLGENYVFQVIGDGGMREALESEIKKRKVSNVKIIPPVKREELDSIYRKSDYLFVHLNDYDAFKKVLPSKIFELATYPQPMILGVGGYAAQFVQENLENVILFEPCNSKDLMKRMNNFAYQRIDRVIFKEKFKRSEVNRGLAQSIISIA